MLSNPGYLTNKRKKRTIIKSINFNSSSLHPTIVTCSGHGAVKETPMTPIPIRPTVLDRQNHSVVRYEILRPSPSLALQQVRMLRGYVHPSEIP